MKIQFDARRLSPAQRAIVTCSAAVFGALACIVYFFVVRGNYEASAVLKFETSMAEYRRLASVAFSEEAFAAWAALQKGSDAEAVETLRWVFASPSRTQQRISPYFRVTKRDLREVPDLERSFRELRNEFGKDEELRTAQLLGIQLEFEGRAESAAVERLRLAARYLLDMALWNAASEYVRSNVRRSVVEVQRLQNELLKKTFETEQLNQKVAELKRLNARYPASNKIAERQLLSVAGEGKTNLFLSPLAQVVGAESELVELRRTVTRTERELEQAKVAVAFFERALERVSTLSSGLVLLQDLQTLRDQVAAEFRAHTSDAVREQINQIGTTLAEYRVVYIDQPPFLSGHQVATFRVMTFPKAAAIGALVGALIGLLVLFAPAALAWLRSEPQTTPA